MIPPFMQEWVIIIFRCYDASVKGLSRTNECHGHAELTHDIIITIVKILSVLNLLEALFYIHYDDLNRGFQELSL